MKRITLKTTLISAILICSQMSMAQELLRSPQKIVIDAKRNRLIVSNEGNGALVQIDSLGIQHPFIPNAGCIDGIEIVGDTIFGVGSGRKLYGYNLVTKAKVMSRTITGNSSYHLSSVTSDSMGHLFISCPEQNKIFRFRISDSTYWVFAENNGLNLPNGILLERDKERIVVVGDSPSPSRIYAISLKDSTVDTLMTTSFKRPDGIVRDKFGEYYLGGYYLAGIYKIDANFSAAPELLFTGSHMVYPTYDSTNHALLVTYYNDDRWARVPIVPNHIHVNQKSETFTFLPIAVQVSTNEIALKYILDKNEKVQIDVYSQDGQHIDKVYEGCGATGLNAINIPKYNICKSRTDLGLYIFKMTVRGRSQVQKAVLIP